MWDVTHAICDEANDQLVLIANYVEQVRFYMCWCNNVMQQLSSGSERNADVTA